MKATIIKAIPLTFAVLAVVIGAYRLTKGDLAWAAFDSLCASIMLSAYLWVRRALMAS